MSLERDIALPETHELYPNDLVIGLIRRGIHGEIVRVTQPVQRASHRGTLLVVPVLLAGAMIPAVLAVSGGRRLADNPRPPAELHAAASTASGRVRQAVSKALPAESSKRAEGAVGVFLTPASVANKDFLDSTMEEIGKTGGNALVFDVKGSSVFFDADLPMAKELGLIRKTYDLKDVIAKAKERGIYTIGRFIAVKDAGFTRARPDSLVAHPRTGGKIGYEFIDPEHADALEYNRQILCALAESGIDEINLDYIRFSTEQFGALGVYSMEEKSRKVTAFVRMARQAIDDCGKQTKLGVSTYAILGWHYESNLRNLGQDVVNWAPFVDIISPMAYPATFAENAYYIPGKNKGSRMYYLVWRTLEGYKELVGAEYTHKIRPWIQGYGVTNKNMVDQMTAVTDAGLCGFTVWNANNAYGVTYKAMPTFKRGEGCM